MSLPFLLFLLGAVLLYYLMPLRIRWVALLICSYVFYLSAGFQLVIYLLLTITSNYLAGRLLDRNNLAYSAQVKELSTRELQKELKQRFTKRKKIIVALPVILNVGVLVFFKWFNTLAAGLNTVLSPLLPSLSIPTFSLLLPLGISFYTFQAVGYLIDVYRGKIPAEKNFAKFMLFVSFFPQLIQGPISRYDELAQQLFEPHHFRFTSLKSGMQLMLWGYFKKMVIADRIVVIVNEIFKNGNRYAGAYILVGTIAGAIYVYTDFSGGVDIARGAAELFGISLPQNFQRPYFSTSLAEYWRRWHITINNWWRDYVFYPLTLSKPFVRLGRFCRQHLGHQWGKMISVYVGIYVVRLINAMWHGANLIYVFSGLYNGLIITTALILTPLFEKIKTALKINTDCFSWRLFQIIRTFLLVCAGRIFVSSPNIQSAFASFRDLFAQFNPHIFFDGTLYSLGLGEDAFHAMVVAILVVLVVSILQEKGIKIRETLNKQNEVFQWLVTVSLIFAIIIFGAYGKGYNPSSFVYMRF